MTDSSPPSSPSPPLQEFDHDDLSILESSTDSSSNENDPNNDSPFPTHRARYVIETTTTDAQTDAEDECAPFFVHLPSLSVRELNHLRRSGLLPPLPPPSAPSKVGGGNGSRRNKAAELLGVADDDDNADDEEAAAAAASSLDPLAIRLLRSKHASYLLRALSTPLGGGFVSLDSSHPWMVYWCLHSLDVLRYFDEDVNFGADDDEDAHGLEGGDAADETGAAVARKAELLKRVVSTLDHCWTDVPLRFSVEDIGNDPFLRDLKKKADGGRDGDGDAAPKVTIVGGGFAGGPDQMPHCAPNYAAVLALCIVAGIGSAETSASKNPYREAGRAAEELLRKRRLQIYAFLLTLREEQGHCYHQNHGEDDGEDGNIASATAFRMQHDGEIDVRATYCALAVAYLLGLMRDSNDGGSEGGGDNNGSFQNPLRHPSIARFISLCQTFEGGFGAEPFNEAHGGYTFCAVAALRILGSEEEDPIRTMIDADAVRSWLARRQMGYEGGFCGRTNKLVDGCYSFWQGGGTAVMDGWYRAAEDTEEKGQGNNNELLFDEIMLQRYILLVAQDVNGGLRDKPSKPRDFYHSCYNLSGLSVAQHGSAPWPPAREKKTTTTDTTTKKTTTADEEEEEGRDERKAEGGDHDSPNAIFGDGSVNIVGRTDPVLNIRLERVRFALSKFWP